MQQNIKTWLGVAIILIFAITAGIFVWVAQKGAQDQDVPVKNAAIPVGNKDVSGGDLPKAEEQVDCSGKVIKKGCVVFQEPEVIGDIGLTDKKLYQGCNFDNCINESGLGSNGIKYVKIGTVVKGDYAGAEIIVIANGVYEAGSINFGTFHILRKETGIVFLSNKLDEYSVNFIKEVFSKGAMKKSFDKDIIIEELKYPDIFTVDGVGNFEKDKYVNIFFTDAKLKKAFIHPKLGQFWTTDETKALSENPTPFELNSYTIDGKKNYRDVFNRHGFYVKAPDGTAVTYKFLPDLFEYKDDDKRYNVLKVIWNDGKRNDKKFEASPVGCGAGDYAYNETLKVNPDTDLVIVGKTEKGENLYGYHYTTSEGFLKLYNETYWVEEGKKKDSPVEFLKKHPKVFWKDPYGRVLAFYNSEFISPAECGKPVIYLYPKSPTDIGVKVRPGRGLSITDPEYGNGWFVRADENSNLMNYADGKNYPYLFWEGAGDVYYEMPKQGFVVKKENLETFFNEKLSRLGLIQKEINDFKEFWIPEMIKNGKPYYFVTFVSKMFMDLNAPLEINPEPDSIIRVMMDYEELDKYKNVPEMRIITPERKGFTVVEWGGMLK